MWAGVIRFGLPSTTSKPTFISGIDAHRLDQRVADQVGEGHLAAAGAGEVVVDDRAVVPQQLHRDRADRRRGRARSARRPCSGRCGPGRRGARCTSARRFAGGGRGRAGLLRHRAAWCPWRARRPCVSGRGLATGAGVGVGSLCSAGARPAARRAARLRLRGGSGAALRPPGRRCDVPLRRCCAPLACRWSGSTSPTWGPRCRDPAGTGRTSPPRATRWRRSRRRGGRTGCLGTAARLDSPLPVRARGEFQSSRLDPRPSKCRAQGGNSAWCATSHTDSATFDCRETTTATGESRTDEQAPLDV